MSKKLVFGRFTCVVLVSLLLAMLIVTPLALERTVGVAEGDWFKYGSYIVSFDTNHPNITFPPFGGGLTAEMNETEWILTEVQNVSHKTVHLRTIRHKHNGTETVETGYVEIEIGSGNRTLMAISANLGENDSIYSFVHASWKINKTEVRSYPDVARETNHLNVTRITNMTYIEGNCTINGTSTSTLNYYWDKPTGILVEFSYELIDHVEEYLTTLFTSYKIIDSSVWIVPEFPMQITFPLFMIMALLVTLVYRRKSIKSTSQKYNW